MSPPAAPAHGGPPWKLAVGALVVVGACAYMFQSWYIPPVVLPTASIAKRLDVTVAWSVSDLQVTGRNTSDAAGQDMVVYINGAPGETYKATSKVPPSGDSVRIPLNQFVTISGDRFNPFAKAVTVAWIGGSGYDYASFRP